jgi:hypothetical protein
MGAFDPHEMAADYIGDEAARQRITSRLPFGDQESVSVDAQCGVMMKASPARPGGAVALYGRLLEPIKAKCRPSAVRRTSDKWSALVTNDNRIADISAAPSRARSNHWFSARCAQNGKKAHLFAALSCAAADIRC